MSDIEMSQKVGKLNINKTNIKLKRNITWKTGRNKDDVWFCFIFLFFYTLFCNKINQLLYIL